MTDKRGGKRIGAGRPPIEESLSGEKTVAFSLRIPESWAQIIREKKLHHEVRSVLLELIKKHSSS